MLNYLLLEVNRSWKQRATLQKCLILPNSEEKCQIKASWFIGGIYSLST